MSLSCTVSEIWRDIGRKSPIITYHTSIWRLRLGVTPLEFRQDLWHQKTRVHALFAWSCI